jgi:hypothetical protein
MRSIVIAVALVSAAASVAQAQQSQSLRPAAEVTAQAHQVSVADPTLSPKVRVVDAPIGITAAQARASSNQPSTTSAAAVDSNTRNTLAIVGAVVIVLALIAFLL